MFCSDQSLVCPPWLLFFRGPPPRARGLWRWHTNRKHITEVALLPFCSTISHALYILYTQDTCTQHSTTWPKGFWKVYHKTQGHRARSHLPTFEEAVLAVDNDDPLPQQAGGTVELTVVLIEPPVGATHGHIAGPAGLQAAALRLPSFPAEHTPAPTAAELLPAGGR
jgi:hypothetical protein